MGSQVCIPIRTVAGKDVKFDICVLSRGPDYATRLAVKIAGDFRGMITRAKAFMAKHKRATPISQMYLASDKSRYVLDYQTLRAISVSTLSPSARSASSTRYTMDRLSAFRADSVLVVARIRATMAEPALAPRDISVARSCDLLGSGLRGHAQPGVPVDGVALVQLVFRVESGGVFWPGGGARYEGGGLRMSRSRLGRRMERTRIMGSPHRNFRVALVRAAVRAFAPPSPPSSSSP